MTCPSCQAQGYIYDANGNVIPTTYFNPLDRIAADGWIRVDNNYMKRLCTPGSTCMSQTRPIRLLLEEYSRMGYTDPIAAARADGWEIYRHITGEYYAAKPCVSGSTCMYEMRPIDDLVRQYNPVRMVKGIEDTITRSVEDVTSALAKTVLTPMAVMEGLFKAGSMIQSAFMFGFDLKSNDIINLSLDSVVGIVDNEINNLQRQLFFGIDMTINGFFNFAFDEFIYPIDNALKNLATIPNAMLLAPANQIYGAVTTNIMKMKEVINGTLFNINFNLMDLMPPFFRKCPPLDEILGIVAGISGSLKEVISNIVGNITGPLNTILDTAQHYIDMAYQKYVDTVQTIVNTAQDFILSIRDLLNTIPNIMMEIKASITSTIKTYVNDVLSGVREAVRGVIAEAKEYIKGAIDTVKDYFKSSKFVSMFKDISEQINRIKEYLEPIIETINTLIQCASALGAPFLGPLMARYNKMVSDYRDMFYSPVSNLARSISSYVETRKRVVTKAVDESIKISEYKERRALSEEYATPSTDIISYVIGNYSELYSKSQTKGTHYNGIYVSLRDGKSYKLTFCEEMLWECTSRLYDVLAGKTTDDNLIRVYNVMENNTYEDIMSSIKLDNAGPIETTNRMIYEIIRRASNTDTNYALLDIGILDTLNFMSTYLNSFNESQDQIYERYKRIIESGRTMGSFVTASRSVNYLYIISNKYKTDVERRETIRLDVLLNLIPVEDLKSYLDYFKDVTDELDPEIVIDIDYTYEHEVSPDFEYIPREYSYVLDDDYADSVYEYIYSS
ncbi:MAG: hypothetical protein QXD03_01955 [Candidatus Anstonellales archaeon]